MKVEESPQPSQGRGSYGASVRAKVVLYRILNFSQFTMRVSDLHFFSSKYFIEILFRSRPYSRLIKLV